MNELDSYTREDAYMDEVDSWVVFLSIVGLCVAIPVLLVAQVVILYGWWSPVALLFACVLGGGLYYLAAIIERVC